MVFVLILIILTTVVVRYVTAPLYGYLWFLLLFVVMPRYMAVGMGVGGSALTVERLALGFFLCVFLSAIAGGRKPWNDITKDAKRVSLMLMLIFFVSCIGTIRDGLWLLSVMYFWEDMTILLFCLFAGWRLSKEKNGLKLFIKYSVIAPCWLTTIFVCIELLRGQPVFAGIINIDDSIYKSGKGFLDILERDGRYRAKALFDHSLQLAEFSAYCVVVTLCAGILRIFNKKVVLFTIISALFCIYFSGSRSAFLLVALCVPSIILFHLIQNKGRYGKLISWGGIVVCAVMGVVVLSNIVMEATAIDVKFYEIEDVKERSTYARLQQFKRVPELVLESPFYGYGYQRNYVDYFNELPTLDNHYFRIALQSGLIGLLLLVFAYFTVIKFSIKNSFSPNYRVYETAFCTTALAGSTIVYKLFIESADNNIYLMVLFFLLSSLTFSITNIRNRAP